MEFFFGGGPIWSNIKFLLLQLWFNTKKVMPKLQHSVTGNVPCVEKMANQPGQNEDHNFLGIQIQKLWTCNILDYWVTRVLCCHSHFSHRAAHTYAPPVGIKKCKFKLLLLFVFSLSFICAFVKSSLSYRTRFFPFIPSCF